MDKIKNFFLNNFITIFLITLCYIIFIGDYSVLLYLFLIYIVSVAAIWIFIAIGAIRVFRFKDLKAVLTRSFLVKLFYVLIMIGLLVKTIDSIYYILIYSEKKEKIINSIVGDPILRPDGSTLTTINDNNDGVKFIFTLPYYSSTESDSLPASTTKEETIKTLKKYFLEKDLKKFKKYDIYFKYLYYNQNDYLVKEIKIDPNEDL